MQSYGNKTNGLTSAVNETREEGLNNIVKVLNAVLDNDYDVKILLETMAGKGNECGINLEEINYLLKNVVDATKLGVCLDTCHLNDSGVAISDFDTYLDDFDKLIKTVMKISDLVLSVLII